MTQFRLRTLIFGIACAAGLFCHLTYPTRRAERLSALLKTGNVDAIEQELAPIVATYDEFPPYIWAQDRSARNRYNYTLRRAYTYPDALIAGTEERVVSVDVSQPGWYQLLTARRSLIVRVGGARIEIVVTPTTVMSCV